MTDFDRWPEGTWLLKVSGETSDLRFGAYTLEVATVHLIEIQETWYLDSPRLRASTERTALQCALNELQVLHGLFRALGLHQVRLVGRGLVRTVLGKPPIQYIHTVPLTSTGRFGYPRFSQEGESSGPTAQQQAAGHHLALIDSRPRVEAVLRVLGRDSLDWYDLYKLHELVQLESGDPVAKGFIQRSILQRLTQTANSADAIGDAARHAPKFRAPTKPMSLDEAKKHVLGLVKKWLNSLDPLA